MIMWQRFNDVNGNVADIIVDFIDFLRVISFIVASHRANGRYNRNPYVTNTKVGKGNNFTLKYVLFTICVRTGAIHVVGTRNDFTWT